MTDPINEEYVLRIVRKDREFEAVEHVLPEDRFGKKMVAVMLCSIAEHLDPDLINDTSTEGS
jgi:hypothetical protein